MRPPHPARYRELVPVRVHFGDPAPGVRLAFDAALLGSPLAMGNAGAMRAAEERCKTLLHGAQGHHRWSDRCAMMLREAEECQPTLEQLAGFTNLSSHTLSRCPDRENNGFRALSLRIRTERACRMLADDAMSVSQIAYRLGYSDVPGFIRAFRNGTGTSPTAYRARQLRPPRARGPIGSSLVSSTPFHPLRHCGSPDSPVATARGPGIGGGQRQILIYFGIRIAGKRSNPCE